MLLLLGRQLRGMVLSLRFLVFLQPTDFSVLLLQPLGELRKHLGGLGLGVSIGDRGPFQLRAHVFQLRFVPCSFLVFPQRCFLQ